MLVTLFDTPEVRANDVIDHLKRLKDFGKMINTAAEDTKQHIQTIQEKVTAKLTTRGALWNELQDKPQPIKKAEGSLQIIGKKVKKDGKWYVYDSEGKKKLGGPYDSEKDANQRIKEVEYFKSQSAKKPVQKKEEPKEVNAAIMEGDRKVKATDVYYLSSQVAKFSAWATISGSARIRPYAASISMGVHKLAQDTGASLMDVKAMVKNTSTTGTYAKACLDEIRKTIASINAPDICKEHKQYLMGIIVDINQVEKLISVTR